MVTTVKLKTASRARAGGRVKSERAKELPLSRSLPSLLRMTHRGFLRALEARLKPYGVPLGIWFYLRVLWEQDGLSQTDLGGRLGVTGPSTVNALNTMENMGLVERRRNPNERRIVNVFLTVEGRKLRTKISHLSWEISELALKDLTSDQRQTLFELLSAVYGAISQHLDTVEAPDGPV